MKRSQAYRKIRGWRRWACCLCCVASYIVNASSLASEPKRDTFAKDVRPFLQKYCVECHAGQDSEAGVAFDEMYQFSDALKTGEIWVRALTVLESRSMPPMDSAQPTSQERSHVTDWIENDLIQALADDQIDMAATVMRRLNRTELSNTLRDLLYMDSEVAIDFPVDEIAFGFDNIGSVLSFSSVHFEKLFAAAERVTAEAIWSPEVAEFAPIELIGLQTYPISSTAPVEFEHRLGPGRYLAEFSLVRVGIADTVAPPRVLVSFGTDAKKLKAVRVQDETVVYRFWIHVVEGDSKVSVSVLSDEQSADPTSITKAVSGDQRYGDKIGLHVDSIVVRGPAHGPTHESPSHHSSIVFIEPELSDNGRHIAAEQIVQRFVRRAYRRPTEEVEVERLMQLFDLASEQGESFEHALQIVLSSVLASPKFLYLVEAAPSDGTRLLSEHELASRLSYFLWATMPDEELLDLADRGALRKNLDHQVARMLANEKVTSFVESFCGQWLQLRRLDEISPDAQLFPTFDAELRQSMQRESEEYFRFVLTQNRNVLELISSDYTFVDRRLASHYGVGFDDEANKNGGAEANDFELVHFANGQRGGLLTQAGILSITSNPNRTSPVKRGKFVLQQILGTPPPPPPPMVESLDGQAADSEASLRDRLVRHREDPACASCHAQMDPIGFALENYDAIGRWRVADEQFAIDASGAMPGGLRFADVNEFKMRLHDEASKRFSRCLIENLLTYALGRGLELSDLRTVEDIRSRLSSNDFRMQSIILGIVRSNPFQTK